MKSHPVLPVLAVLVGIAVVVDPVVGPASPTTVFHHPHDVCSVVTLPPNFPDDPTVFTASYGSMNLFLRSRNRGFGWRNMRSGMLGHVVSDCEIAPDWAASKLIYVAVGKDGLQRSTDGGDTWEPPLLQEHVTQVEVAELVGGVRSVVCGGGKSVWFSGDGGDNWSVIGTPPHVVQAIAIPDSFATEPCIAVGTAGPVIYVKRGLAEWTAAAIPSPAHVVKFSPDFEADRTIWAGTYGHGLYRSTDAGQSFQRVGGLVPTEINDLVLAPSWPACRDVFVATPKAGVHASRDGGATWSRLPMHLIETYQTDNHYQSLAISARYPEDPTLYRGAYEGLYCSTNGGDNWFELNLNPTRIGRKVAISPGYGRDNHVFMVGYGNPFILSPDAGDSWEFRSRGVRTMGAYSLAASPDFERDSLILVGMGSGIRRTADAGHTWEAIALEPVSPTAKIGSFETRQVSFSPDFATDRGVFAVTAAGFYHSTDAGKTWKGHPVPPDWTWRFAIAPDWSRTQTAFLGGYNVWRSDNGGAEWKRLHATGKVLGIECAPDFATTGDVYLVSEDRGLMRSRDRGDTWQLVEHSFEGYSPTKIRLSPTFLQDRMMFVSTVSGGLFVSRDRGVTWARCAPLGGQADTCFDFVVSPELGTDQTLYGCTFDGLIKSTDLGRTWSLTTKIELYDDQRDPWLLRGAWEEFHTRRLFGVGGHRAQVAGAEAVLPFTGTAIKLFGTAGPDHGRCEILLDGERVAEVDCYAATANQEFVLYDNRALGQGFHDLRVRVIGKANARATGKWVSIDAAVVEYSPVDDDNRVFAKLENLHLSPDTSYSRDTKSQNKKVDELRESLSAPAQGAPGAAALQTRDPELRDQLRAMAERIEHITEDLKVLSERIQSLDRALHEREKANGR